MQASLDEAELAPTDMLDYTDYEIVLEEMRDAEYKRREDGDDKEFFVHALSGKSVWQQPMLNVWLHDLHASRPPGLLAEVPTTTREANPIAMGCPPPEQAEWVEQYNSEHGRPYWVNIWTSESTWTRPPPE